MGVKLFLHVPHLNNELTHILKQNYCTIRLFKELHTIIFLLSIKISINAVVAY